MCGRFTLTRLEDFIKDLPWVGPPDEPPPPRYNVAPSQAIAVVPNSPEHKVEFFQWGLIPSWAKDPAIGNRMINARAETLAEKPAFRKALARRRCVIPADGFYEWRKDPDGRKSPMLIRLKSGRPLGLAGLWETWQSPDGSLVRSCTIITTMPNELMRDIHNRMPVVLPAAAMPRWLEPCEAQAGELIDLLVPFPAEQMEAFEVSRMVNNPAVDRPECARPVGVTPDQRPPADGGLFGPARSTGLR